MKEKTNLQKYAYYKDVLKKMGGFPLSEDLTIEKLNLTRGKIQAAYKEMYGLKFEGTIIDYLCWISTLYILDTAKNNTWHGNSRKPDAFTYAKYIIKNYKSFLLDLNNLLRLFVKKPSYYFNWIHEDERQQNGDKPSMVMEEKVYGREINGKFFSVKYHGQDVETHALISGFWFLLLQKESYNEQEGELLLEAYIRLGFLKGIIEDDETKYEPEIPQESDKLATG